MPLRLVASTADASPPPPPPNFDKVATGSRGHGISLLHGWLPPTVEIAALVLVLVVIGWRTRRRLLVLPAMALVLVSSLIVLNQWVGYFPTVQIAWKAINAAPLPQQTSLASLSSLRGKSPETGKVVPIQTPDTASGMFHRTEYVYLPPAWFTGATPPKLPVVMMIGGEFATPDDWIRIGNILPALDTYATKHDGWAPILVFVDTGGTFTNDTECVNGPRDNVATHLTQDVPPYVEKTFGTATSADQWAVTGWSMGGTCAIDLAVMHPEQFGTFIDIAGDIGPNTGNKDQTIQRLYGGNAQQRAAFDPRTVMTAHGPYTGMTGLLYAFTPAGPYGKWTGGRTPGGATDEHTFLSGKSSNTIKLDSAAALYTTATKAGIAATLYSSRGNHTWQAASGAFGSALPWLFDHLHTATAAP
ncbi:alpha/beta hydrolase [Nocardia sp. NPDC088792]|uniref:alpha/beta hydrolase n=1 Tax=Nocardia sp. NPDC088792 TaxID=3364332 RepID=UPI0037FF82A7